MRIRLFAIFPIIILFVCVSSFAAATTIRIMPLGDSITRGDNDGITNNDYIVGYRQQLYLDLIDSGYDVHFVGSLSAGRLAEPAFDIHHEGHGGWCADGCSYPFDDILDYVYTFLTNNPADVVLLHIGSNDISINGESAAEVGAILDEIYRYNKNIIVVLARIISRTDGKAAQVTAFNKAVAAMALARPEYGSTLFLVDMEHALTYPDDMSDDKHPNQTGYNKMADVWFNALISILPAPMRQLTVYEAGAGQGTVTSEPAAINCGSTCTATFSQGTVVVLTAVPSPGSSLSSWKGCDSVNGNSCAVNMTSERTVTATFEAITEVKLLYPNGGETIPAGSKQVISWEAPPDAVSFKVFYTPGRKIGVVGACTDTLWTVPLVKKNKSTYRVKITAYNSRKRKIGSDKSDGTFTIELGRVTFPNQGDTCTGGQTCTITWTKSDHVPVSSIQLSYKLKKGQGWKKIPDILPGDATSFEWTPPVFSYPQTSCMIRLTFMNSAGRKIGTVESDGVFRVEPGP